MANPKRRLTSKQFFYGGAIAFICAIAMGVIAIQYANYVDRKSNRQWCRIVVAMDDTYKVTPPRTSAGQILAAEMARLRKDFDC